MMTNNTNTIPEGYRSDSLGRLIPLSKIAPIDLFRDEFVNEKIAEMRVLNEQLIKLKRSLLADINAFVDLSAEKYGVSVGGKAGNVTLRNFDGSAKIQLQVAKNLVFDERLQVAKVLVDNCIKRWSMGANDNLHVLVDDAFQVDKEGKINTQRILSLTRIKINDEEWQKAMDAINDSLSVVSTTTYVRGFVQKETNEPLKALVLDLARV
ncbi:MAG: DUF3164 family protein [Ostreibacterium sp.]